MGDIMRPVPFEELLTRIFDEYQQHHSIFGIPEQQFYSPTNQRRVSVFGESCATPPAWPPARIPNWRRISLPPGSPAGGLSS